MRGAQGLRFAFDPRLPAVRRFNAEDHLGGFRASGTQQAGEAYNFSRADLQVERGDGSFYRSLQTPLPVYRSAGYGPPAAGHCGPVRDPASFSPAQSAAARGSHGSPQMCRYATR